MVAKINSQRYDTKLHNCHPALGTRASEESEHWGGLGLRVQWRCQDLARGGAQNDIKITEVTRIIITWNRLPRQGGDWVTSHPPPRSAPAIYTSAYMHVFLCGLVFIRPPAHLSFFLMVIQFHLHQQQMWYISWSRKNPRNTQQWLSLF